MRRLHFRSPHWTLENPTTLFGASWKPRLCRMPAYQQQPLALISPSAVFSREFDVWVADSVMPGQGVGATECLLFGA